MITTKDGPPDIFVEVGKPFSKDPYLITGIFKAIYSVSNELTSNPLQVIQAKGFTIKFRQLEDGSILMVGSDTNIAALELLLGQCNRIITDGQRFNLSVEEIEAEIQKVVKAYFENKDEPIEKDDAIPRAVKLGFQRLPKEFLTVIFWGLLTQRHFRFPNTGSLDFDHYISSVVDYLGQSCCSNFDKECLQAIQFVNEKGGFMLGGAPEILDAKYSLIQKTNLLKKLEKLGKKGRISELREILYSARATITSMAEMVRNYPDLDEQTKFDIDRLRYSIGLDLEHYLVEYLKLIDYPYLDQFLEHAQTIEWVNPWLI